MEFRVRYNLTERIRTTIYKDRELYVAFYDNMDYWDWRGKDLGFIDDIVWEKAEPIDANAVAKLMIENGLF